MDELREGVGVQESFGRKQTTAGEESVNVG